MNTSAMTIVDLYWDVLPEIVILVSLVKDGIETNLNVEEDTIKKVCEKMIAIYVSDHCRNWEVLCVLECK
jgi:hypothetical protein